MKGYKACARKFILLASLWTLVSLLAVGGGWGLFNHYRHSPLSGMETPRIIEIVPGEGFSTITQKLQAQGIIRSRWPFMAMAALQGRTTRIRAGEYRLSPGITPQGLLDQLVKGEILLHRLTLVEGWTFRQVRGAVAGHPEIRQTLTDLTDDAVMGALGDSGLSPEGRFFPDTYLFPRGTSDLKLLQQAHHRLQAELEAAWAARQPDLPFKSPVELLTLASLVEKETALASERPQIAGVFVRRLRLGMPLQTDPTVIFGLGADFDGNIRRRDLQMEHPYNTYRIAGLPPGPIALVGRAALAAAAHPAPGDTLYFVSRGDGSHVFSSTLEAHNRAVNCYQRKQCLGVTP
ncbi:MAG: endolytic transglycosylase MltG [Candidatus Macondimonas sp.]